MIKEITDKTYEVSNGNIVKTKARALEIEARLQFESRLSAILNKYYFMDESTKQEVIDTLVEHIDDLNIEVKGLV